MNVPRLDNNTQTAPTQEVLNYKVKEFLKNHINFFFQKFSRRYQNLFEKHSVTRWRETVLAILMVGWNKNYIYHYFCVTKIKYIMYKDQDYLQQRW